MRIEYKKRHLNNDLFSGLSWLVLFFIVILMKDEIYWYYYQFVLLSTIFLIKYFYQRHNKYLTIKNGIIKINNPFGKKLNLTEIKRIKKFRKDYILKTDSNKLTINTEIIDPNSLTELNAELEKLNVEWY